VRGRAGRAGRAGSSEVEQVKQGRAEQVEQGRAVEHAKECGPYPARTVIRFLLLTSHFTRSLLQIDLTPRVIRFILSFRLTHYSVPCTPPTLLIELLVPSLLFTVRVLPASVIL
jgi:hypothetical protein